jgi:hypothetical protein
MTYSAGLNPNFVAVGDFNNDIQLDIVVVNNGDNNIGILLGHGNGSFSNQTTYSTGLNPNFVAVGDFNNDTQLDIVVVNNGDNNIGILLGHGNGSFSNQTTYFTGFNSGSSSVAIGDFNNDSQLDIVVTNELQYNVGIFLGGPYKVFKLQLTLITGNGSLPLAFAIGDFNNDMHMDIAIANSGTNNVGIFLGYGNDSFTNQTIHFTGSSPRSLAVGDFNNDTRLDIVVANSNDNNVGILLGYGNGLFTNQTTYSTGISSQPYSVAVGDFDSDTLLDIIVANYRANDVVVLLGYGNGTFADPKMFSIGYGTSPFVVVGGDFNNDKKLDFAVANYGTDNLKILLQTC